MSGSFIRCLAVFLLIAVLAAGCTGSCKSDKPPEERRTSRRVDLDEQQTLIRQHRELVKSGEPLSEEQRELFADAYYKVGHDLFRRRKRAESEPYFGEALRLWPRHARAIVRLGDLHALRREFKAAAQAYERAGKLDVGLRATVAKRRARLVNFVLLIADQRIRDYQIAGARQVLEFVQEYLGDVGADEAGSRLEKLEPLLRIEQLLDEAQADIAGRRKTDGYKKLREVATSHSRTYFGQEANRLLEENGQKIVLRDTATGYKLPPHWRRTSIEHFEIYYEKRAALTGSKRYAEQAFSKIMEDFGMDDVQWKTRITMYLFSDRESWREFLAMNRDKTMEWAGGFALPWANEIYLYVTEKKKNLYKGVLPHELTHVLHHRYVGGVYQPLWLKEGLARWQEKGGVKEARDAIDRLVKRGKAFPLGRFLNLQFYPAGSISLFYAQSATVVGFIVDEYDLDALKEFMFAFKNTRNSVEVIDEVFGVTLDTFEKKWEKYVR